MLKIENAEVVGWEHAIRGMRNPMNSWEKSDTTFYDDTMGEYHDICGNCGPFNHDISASMIMGASDFDLMTRLRNAGTDHRKFMRMIVVYVDITAPLYWWKEMDTYRVGVEKNSCSTMHKIHAKEFTLEDFSCEHLSEHSLNHLKQTIDLLNFYRADFNNPEADGQPENRKFYWWQMIQLLPSSYNQRRTFMLNYEVLANIYKSRRNHKLDEWHTFCDWIEGLPYSQIITGKEETA